MSESLTPSEIADGIEEYLSRGQAVPVSRSSWDTIIARLRAPSAERRITPELIEICELLLDYRRRNGANFQLEKADDYLRRMDRALDET